MKKLLIFSIFCAITAFGASPSFQQSTQIVNAVTALKASTNDTRRLNLTNANNSFGGSFSASAGTASVPSLGWAEDNDGSGTGFYRNAANRIAISVNGGFLGQIYSSGYELTAPITSFTALTGNGTAAITGVSNIVANGTITGNGSGLANRGVVVNLRTNWAVSPTLGVTNLPSGTLLASAPVGEYIVTIKCYTTNFTSWGASPLLGNMAWTYEGRAYDTDVSSLGVSFVPGGTDENGRSAVMVPFDSDNANITWATATSEDAGNDAAGEIIYILKRQ